MPHPVVILTPSQEKPGGRRSGQGGRRRARRGRRRGGAGSGGGGDLPAAAEGLHAVRHLAVVLVGNSMEK